MDKIEAIARAVWFSKFHPLDVEGGVAEKKMSEWPEDWVRARKTAQAALEAADKWDAENGFVRVPEEPTEAIICAGQEAYEPDYEYGLDDEDMARCYKAMNKAARSEQ